MPLKKDQSIPKLYYSIGEVSEILKVNASLIRYWDDQFDLIQPKKNRKGNRLFSPKDVENLKLIYHLVKERGYTLEGARKKLKYEKADTERQYELIGSLKSIRQFLSELKEDL